MSFACFDIEALPLELQDLISSPLFLDEPSRLSFSLVSKAFRRRWRIGRDGEFDTWRFIFECARRGYVALLEYALTAGAPLSTEVLEFAIEAQQWLVVRFLLPRLTVALLVPSRYDSRVDIVSSIARYGDLSFDGPLPALPIHQYRTIGTGP